MKFAKLMSAVLAIGAVALAVSACQKKEDAPGPAETMGKQIDSAVKNAGDQANVAADKAQEKVQGTASEAGQKLDQAVANAKDEAKNLAQKAGEKIEAAGQKIQDAAQDAKK